MNYQKDKHMTMFYKSCLLALVGVLVFAQCKPGNKENAETAAALAEQHDPAVSITGTFWNLVEINGQPVPPPSNVPSAAHIRLQEQGYRLTGFGGCNTLAGNYELNEKTLRLRFTDVATTLKACDRMELEEELMKVLSMTDSYAINGRILSLHKARMAPLARFEAVGE